MRWVESQGEQESHLGEREGSKREHGEKSVTLR